MRVNTHSVQKGCPTVKVSLLCIELLWKRVFPVISLGAPQKPREIFQFHNNSLKITLKPRHTIFLVLGNKGNKIQFSFAKPTLAPWVPHSWGTLLFRTPRETRVNSFLVTSNSASQGLILNYFLGEVKGPASGGGEEASVVSPQLPLPWDNPRLPAWLQCVNGGYTHLHSVSVHVVAILIERIQIYRRTNFIQNSRE